MFPFNRPLKTWTEEDLQMLCGENQPETTRLKYMKEVNPDPVGGRYELLANMTAMANSLGGVIVFGIEDYWDDLLGRCAGKLVPLKDPGLKEKIVRIIDSHISPGIIYFLHMIETSKNGYYLVIHVPQSLNRPHSFTWESHLCWYMRKDQDNRLLTESEVRDLYFKAAIPRQSLIERYNSLYLRNSVQAELKLVVLPVAGGLELIDTITMSGEELMLGSKLFTQLSGISGFLVPKIDHFEAVFKNHNILFIIKLLKNGEFLFSMGYDFLERVDYVPMPRLYVLWHHALKYFGQLYAALGYYGPLRIYLETRNLNHEKIKVALKFGCFQNFLKDRILVYKDTTVEGLGDTEELFSVCTSLLKYIAQGCDMGVEEEYLIELEKQVKNRISDDEVNRLIEDETAAMAEEEHAPTEEVMESMENKVVPDLQEGEKEARAHVNKQEQKGKKENKKGTTGRKTTTKKKTTTTNKPKTSTRESAKSTQSKTVKKKSTKSKASKDK